jgi:ABC-2 type transport system ATP-binding protein
MLRFEDVHFRYPGAPQASLEGVDMEVDPASAFGLLGPNGAGKTTLLHLAAGLLPLQRGRITLGGVPIGRTRDPRRLALVPQDIAFYPQLTVRENLRFFGRVQGLGGARLRERVDAMVAFAQLEGFLGRLGGQLSGGLKRRLNLALGLLAEPETLLLDEPSVGVDPQSRHFLLEAIAGLQRAGHTLVYTSHYMDEIERLCGQVAILDRGKVLLAGTLGQVLDSAPPALALRLSGPMPPALETPWRERLGLEVQAGHRYQIPGLPPDQVGALLEALHREGARVEAWSWGQQHLDDVFMALTHRALRDE